MGRRSRNLAGWPNETDSWRKEARMILDVNRPLMCEVGTPAMRQLGHTTVDRYTPTLGGYPLQRESREELEVSLENILEIAEHLGQPFLMERAPNGLLFSWNGTLGSTETFFALGFGIKRSVRACYGTADMIPQYIACEDDNCVSIPVLAPRKMSGVYGGVAFYAPSIRTRDSISRKRWPEQEAARA